MKILLVSNLFPPFVMGGAEMAAHSLARWLVGQGHDVRVLTGAPAPSDEGTETLPDGLAVERRHFANVYQVYRAQKAAPVDKLRWHWQDHFHPQAEKICGEVIDDFGPDVVNCHDLQGIGYNLLKAIGERDLPCVQTLHDFGFVCLSMNMFRHGRECGHHHLACAASTWVKRSYFNGVRRLAFMATSAALLERYRPYLPAHAKTFATNVPLFFPDGDDAPAPRDHDGVTRFLYAGQLEPWKGVEFLISVLEELAATHRFHLTLLGGGSLLEPLRARAEGIPWLGVAGKVPPGQVGGHMKRSDLLVVPSQWFENAPLVISQALEMGLPVLGSDTGGIPEMITPGVNGDLVPRSDRAAWTDALGRVLREPARLAGWREGAESLSKNLSQDSLGARVLEIFRQVGAGERQDEPTATGKLQR